MSIVLELPVALAMPTKLRQPKLSRRVKPLIRMVSYCVIFKMMVVITKDLRGNSSNRFKKIKN